MKIQIKRVYEDAAPGDGYRVLVDRLWPRGVKKVDLAPDRWAKELAPSTEARKAFAHKAENFEEFRGRYTAELDASEEAHACAAEIANAARVAAAGEDGGGAGGSGKITLLYAAKDPQVNHAVVLKAWLERELEGQPGGGTGTRA